MRWLNAIVLSGGLLAPSATEDRNDAMTAFAKGRGSAFRASGCADAVGRGGPLG